MKNAVEVCCKDYVAGWLDATIHDFLADFPRPKTMKVALITSLDSDISPGELLAGSPELQPLARVAERCGAGILLPAKSILNGAVGREIFHGFDEVWFFPQNKVTAKPPKASLVGPNRIDRAKLNRLGTWMESNGCLLGLGDGDGLNFIVKARGLAKLLLCRSLSQPRPEGGGEEDQTKSRDRRTA